jgi:hypothetical protein
VCETESTVFVTWHKLIMLLCGVLIDLLLLHSMLSSMGTFDDESLRVVLAEHGSAAQERRWCTTPAVALFRT